MKVVYLIAALLLTNLLAIAQDEKGIRFEKGLNWVEIREKAKKENKYIFLDGFTTWCGPCKMMAKDIFPQAKVGEFFNNNFINVAVQFDVTKKDNEEVKSWYKDAAEIQKTYSINSYPSYLFFSPQGELVHAVHSAVPDADEFIRLASEAIDPEKQFLNLKKRYEEGNRDPDFLYALTVSAIANWDNKMARVAATSYLKTQPDLLTDRNLKLLPVLTKTSSDPGFKVLRDHADRADLILGKGYSKEIVRTIIFDEIVLPVIRIGGEKIDHGLMIEYRGELSKDVDWKQLKTQLDAKFPEYSEEVMMSSQLTYLNWAKDWKLLNKTIAKLLSENKNAIRSPELTRLANEFFLRVDDINILNETLAWAKLSLSNIEDQQDKLNFMTTYAQLLDKAGQKDEAIKQVETAVELTGGKTQYFIDMLEKMKNSNKIK